MVNYSPKIFLERRDTVDESVSLTSVLSDYLSVSIIAFLPHRQISAYLYMLISIDKEGHKAPFPEQYLKVSEIMPDLCHTPEKFYIQFFIYIDKFKVSL